MNSDASKRSKRPTGPAEERTPYVPRHTGIGRWFRAADSSVRARVLIPTAILFACTIAAMIFVSYRLQRHELRRQEREHGVVIAKMVKAELSAQMLKGGPKQVPELLDSLVEFRADVESISIIRPSTRLVAFSSREALVGTAPWSDRDPYQQQTVVADREGDTFAVVQPIRNEAACRDCHDKTEIGDINGWLDVRINRPPGAPWEVTRVLLITAVPMFVILLGIAWWLLTSEVVMPIRRLRGTMARAEDMSSNVLADEGRPDELGEVARSFDDTLLALRKAQREVEAFYRERAHHVDRFAAIGELATGLAHEIKNPLAGISGALEILIEDAADEPEHLELLVEMQRQLLRLSNTMEGMLNFAHPPKVKLAETDLSQSLERVMFLVRQQARKQSAPIAVVYEPPPGIPLALADPAQLEQALLNISLNAIQAMRETGGELVVRVFADEARVCVELSDSGPGIPEDVRQHIFEPYFTTKGTGTGLGLALSARIVADHGGTIDYECPESGGTTFFVTLQAAAPRVEEMAV